MPWHIYVGAASRANFSIAMNREIWGAKYDFFSELMSGDTVFFHHAISANRKPAPSGFPKFCTFDEFTGILESVTEVALTSDSYVSDTRIWPDDEYPYRFNFKIINNEEQVTLNESTISESIRIAIHSSLKTKSKPKWSDSTFMQSPLAEPLEEEDDPIDEESDRDGWVYVITNPAWGDWVKIGCTVHPPKRLGNYNTSSPLRDYHAHCWKRCVKAWESEQLIHSHLRNELSPEFCKNEWFKITPYSAEDVLRELLGDDDFAYIIP